MTRNSVSGWQRRQLSTISATKSGRSSRTWAYSSRMAGLAQASIRCDRASSKTSADTLFSAGNVASLSTHVSRTTLKIRLGATQCPRAPLGFYERDRFLFGHRFAAVFAVRASERRREPESDDLPIHYSCRMHGTRLPERKSRTRWIKKQNSRAISDPAAVIHLSFRLSPER